MTASSVGPRGQFSKTLKTLMQEMQRLWVPLRGEGSCRGGGAHRDSAGCGATEEGLTSRGGSNLRLPLRFGLRPQGNPEIPAFPGEEY